MIEILEPGPLTTVQDLGRPGYADLAVPHSGAFDRGAARAANRLVGNDGDAAVLEATLGGLAFRAVDAITVACTGATCPGLDWGVAVSLPAGRVVRLGAPTRGLRSYLGVRGGIEVEPVLGSRSTDTLSGLGPAPVARGDRLATGRARGEVSAALVPAGGPSALQARRGPRDDWFTDEAVRALFTTRWTVRADCDRVGIRLDGPALERRVTRELPSEATLPGAVQVPADGRPILFGPDGPVTGGYPVIAVVRRSDLDHAAQLRPGDEVSFVLPRPDRLR